MKQAIRGITAKVRNFFATFEAIWNYLVIPLMGLIVWVALVTAFTKFSATDALLVVLAFSVWYCTHHIVSQLSKLELYLARIVIQQVPGAIARVRLRTDRLVSVR